MIADAGGRTFKHLYIKTSADMLVPSPPTVEALGVVRRDGAMEQRVQFQALSLLQLDVLKSGLADDVLNGRVPSLRC